MFLVGALGSLSSVVDVDDPTTVYNAQRVERSRAEFDVDVVELTRSGWLCSSQSLLLDTTFSPHFKPNTDSPSLTQGAFDFISFYISFTYLYSFVLIVKPWPLLHATYFSQTQTVALTVFAIVAGGVARVTRRYAFYVFLLANAHPL